IASARAITGVPKMLVCVTSTTELATNWGTLENPNLKTGSGSRFEDIPNGCSVYVFTMENFTAFTKHVADFPWISQGIIPWWRSRILSWMSGRVLVKSMCPIVIVIGGLRMASWRTVALTLHRTSAIRL
ncbi:hypothetical protein DD594_28560, partial [Enterobacter cloacae complex sp. 4DZ1-17B1]